MPSATLSLFEIPADDSRKLADFFRAVFGWDAVEVRWAAPQASFGDGPRYLRLLPPTSAEPPGGGILERGSGAALVDRLTVMIRVEGEPLEAVLARVEAAGGVPLRAPSAIGASGRFARFLDPEGNSFGLWSD